MRATTHTPWCSKPGHARLRWRQLGHTTTSVAVVVVGVVLARLAFVATAVTAPVLTAGTGSNSPVERSDASPVAGVVRVVHGQVSSLE